MLVLCNTHARTHTRTSSIRLATLPAQAQSANPIAAEPHLLRRRVGELDLLTQRFTTGDLSRLVRRPRRAGLRLRRLLPPFTRLRFRSGERLRLLLLLRLLRPPPLPLPLAGLLLRLRAFSLTGLRDGERARGLRLRERLRERERLLLGLRLRSLLSLRLRDLDRDRDLMGESFTDAERDLRKGATTWGARPELGAGVECRWHSLLRPTISLADRLRPRPRGPEKNIARQSAANSRRKSSPRPAVFPAM